MEQMEIVPVTFQLAALRALLAVIDNCQPRIHKWKGTIISSVMKFWVLLQNYDDKREGSLFIVLFKLFDLSISLEMKPTISDIFTKVAEICPDVIEVK